MASRSGNGNRQLAAGIVVPEQDLRHGAAALLTQIPAFEDHGHMAGDVINGEWPAVKQKDDDRLAGFEDGLDQVLLPPRQIEAGAISEVLERPGFP